ncbi:hypothetical protein ABZ858_24150 [Streptomyces sp. NPDC047017]|uniref:hypothetical protein n=1 Tax=Streptomyces sp. NPDC047017 TaxID=3155024 RepID=UPI003411ECCB
MDLLRPARREEAPAAKAGHSSAPAIAGGAEGRAESGSGLPGAPVPDGTIMDSLRAGLPGPALTPHTVASPLIRYRGGAGGSLGTVPSTGGVRPAPPVAGAGSAPDEQIPRPPLRPEHLTGRV